MREWVSGPILDRSLVQADAWKTEERERTAHLIAASLTFSVFCSEKPEQTREGQLRPDSGEKIEDRFCRNL